jgi:hypothetical protein
MGKLNTGTLVAIGVVAAVVFAVGATLLIGDNGDSSADGNGAVGATPTPGDSTVPTQTPDGDEPVAATPGVPGTSPTQPPASPTPLPPDYELFEAPIESVEVVVRESFPPQYGVHIVAGLPSGCAEPGGHELERDGDTFRITVYDSRPSGDVICTAIYGYYDVNVDLGSDLVSGTTYTVEVNDKVETFVAQ